MAVLGSAVGAVLCCLPGGVAERVRAGLRDVAGPGHVALQSLLTLARTRSPETDAGRVERLEQELSNATRQALSWQARSARMGTELDDAQRQSTLSVAPRRTQPLVKAEVLEARILAWEGGDVPRSRPVLDRGGDRDLKANDIVLSATDPVIDVGNDLGLKADHPVVAGRAVVGRIGTVGAWTSTVQRITDPGYRGHAQLVRASGESAVEGAEGIVRGDEAGGCALHFVGATEPVRVGDLVVTPLGQAWCREPLLYGTVIRAELDPGASHWEIDVQPLCDLRRVTHVAVVKTILNPRRAGSSSAMAPFGSGSELSTGSRPGRTSRSPDVGREAGGGR